MINSLIFCFPSRGVGGVSLLFSRLASYLNSTHCKVGVIDYADGYMAKHLDPEVELFPYQDDAILKVPSNAVLVFQAMTPWSIYPNLDMPSNTRLFFLSTVPVNLYPFLPILRGRVSRGGFFSQLVWHSVLYLEFNKCRRFLACALNKNAIAFLDADVVCNLKNAFKVDMSAATIIPLFSDNSDYNLFLRKDCLIKPNKIIIGWLGRLSDFKIHILNRVLADARILSSESSLEIEIRIVGSGEYKKQLILHESKQLSVCFYDEVSPDKLDTFLPELDVLFAMGTSALEGAKLGVPTIVLDYSFKPVADSYRYNWLYETKGFCLGRLIEGEGYEAGVSHFSDIMKEVLTSRKSVSEKTFSYYQKQHAINVSAKQLLEGVLSSLMRWFDIKDKKLNKSFSYERWKSLRKMLVSDRVECG